MGSLGEVLLSTTWHRPGVGGFLFVLLDSVLRSQREGLVAAAESAGRRREKKKKNLGSDLNLVSTGVWPC